MTAETGRPTKYDPEYCEGVVAAGAQGYSLTAFAGMIGVCRDTLHEWGKVHPEFSDAVKRHGAARTYCLETELLKAESGPKVTSRIFALKNAAPAEWKDKQEHEHTGKDGAPIAVVDLTGLTDDQLSKIEPILALLAASAGRPARPSESGDSPPGD